MEGWLEAQALGEDIVWVLVSTPWACTCHWPAGCPRRLYCPSSSPQLLCVCAELWLGLRCLVKWPSSLDADTWYKWGVACSTAALYWPWAVWDGIMEYMLGHRSWFKSHFYDLLVGRPWANYLISESVSSYPNWEFPWGLNERIQAKYLVQFQAHNGLLIKRSHEDSPTLRRWDSGLMSISGTREMACGQ